MARQRQERPGNQHRTFKQDAIASRGMVASNHPMASAARIEVLSMGGNAIDAAIATAFALTVVEPMMVGIFGAGFINHYSATTGDVHTIDNYAVAPLGATANMYEPVSDTWPDYLETAGRRNRVGYLAVGVPGALKGWCHVVDGHGRLGLETVIQPAIRFAERGSPASRYLVDIIADCRQDLARFPASKDVFLPGGAPPGAGQPIVRRDYADTLRLVAREGSDALYRGRIGEIVAADMEANGGIVTGDDLEGYEIREREPVRGSYRGYDIVSVGPASAGGVNIIQVLNILEDYDIADMGFGSTEYVHVIAEALKIAFADRFEYMGDPDFVEVPLGGITSKEYATSRRRELDLEQAGDYRHGRPSSYAGESDNTTHLTVADGDGNVVSMTQTIHSAFGSKVTVPGTGMLLNNNMYIFDPHPGLANSIAPGKRMLSSMSPTLVLKDGRPFMALGTPGGTRIFPSVLQAIINVIDHGMTLQEAVEAPRVWTQGQSLEVEEGIQPSVRVELKGRGHPLEVVAKVAGGMNGVMFDHGTGLIRGAACWRADGAPIGISGGPAKQVSAGATYYG